MRPHKRNRFIALAAVAVIAVLAVPASAQEPESWLNVYGFAQLDMGYSNRQNHPDWYDVIRPTKLPSFENEFGEDGNFYGSVRQSRLGVKGGTPTAMGEVKGTFEFEMFGTGVDAGQTTFRLRHAYAELGQFGAGQTNSVFMDGDVFPNSLEYWGPSGMVFFRNIQVRWMPIQGDTRLTIALERPGGSADLGDYSERIELQNVKAQFEYPDISAEYRYGSDWGYVEAAGIWRKLKWNDTLEDGVDLSDEGTGWGINLSSNIKFAGGKDVLRVAYVFGEGVENYMNDATVDVGVELNDDPARPFEGKLLPVSGVTAFLDHTWNDKFTSAVGYSSVKIDNSDGQAPNAFHRGHYALANVLYTPVKNWMMGGEIQWGKRENFSDGYESDDIRVQFSVRANFGKMFGGNS